MENCFYPFINTDLAYSFDALEPYIDEKTMLLHHNKHLQAYINNLNSIISCNPQLKKLSLEQLIRNCSKYSQKLQTELRNNAGGVYNHRFFFDGMINSSEYNSDSALAHAINCSFGSFDGFKAEFTKASLSVFGSGYSWLVHNGNILKIKTTPNQNNPLECGFCPILCLDVWEHAYYLKYNNLRADYIHAWFNIINWGRAEQLFEKKVRC